jgi:hypothetical protein
MCKRKARRLNVPQLKDKANKSFQKTYNVNKTCQLKPGKGADISGLYYKHVTIVNDNSSIFSK